MSEHVTPSAILAAARLIISTEGAHFDGAWSRSAAHLARQALEMSVDHFWMLAAPGLRDASRRAQFICLPEYLGDSVVAGRAAYTWSALSQACHHHAYELSPTATELGRWIDSIDAFGAAIERATK